MKAADFEEFISSLRSPGVQNLARFFVRNLERAEDLRWVHRHLIYPKIMERREMEIIRQVIKDRSVNEVLGPDSGFTVEFRREVGRRLQEDEEGLVTELARGAREEEDKLITADPRFATWIKALQQSSAMAVWSAFETLVSDLWIHAVNSRPDLFAVRALQQFTESLQRHGLSSRSIPIGIAAKYKFDLRNHIGDIISDIIDFTKLDDVKKAYSSAFGVDEDSQKLLQSAQLKKLVLVRNLIAHRSGIVDAEYKDKSGCSENIGDELTISNGAATEFLNTVRDVGIYLLKQVDGHLAT